MRISDDAMRRLEADLGLNVSFVKGGAVPVRNCWHFHSDGNAVDAIFYDHDDFRHGMNRMFKVLQVFDVYVLAFVLMDTHFHFILYGGLDECSHFVREYIRQTSFYISKKYGYRNKLVRLSVSHQTIEDDMYLKTAICYTFKNPVTAGLDFLAYDYPWSSCPLMFRHHDCWSSPAWTFSDVQDHFGTRSGELPVREWRSMLLTRTQPNRDLRMIGDMVFPGEYTAYQIAQRIFRTSKSFQYYMSKTRESDVEERGGILHNLSVPMQEMRQHKNEVCQELFGKKDLRCLSVDMRVRLARTLKARYSCSGKQIARLCGLVYDEVRAIL